MSMILKFDKQTLVDDWMSITVSNGMFQNLNRMHIMEVKIRLLMFCFVTMFTVNLYIIL